MGALRAGYTPGLQQVADLLTKPLERARFATLRARLMNTENQVEARPTADESGAQEEREAFDQRKRTARLGKFVEAQ